MTSCFFFELATVARTSSKIGHRLRNSSNNASQLKSTMLGYWFFLNTDGFFLLHSSVQHSSRSCNSLALNCSFKDGILYMVATMTDGILVSSAFASLMTLSTSKTCANEFAIYHSYTKKNLLVIDYPG